MTKEFNEPWVVECDEDGVFVADCDGDEITTLDKDEARRIVACVNACKDMTTEALENIAADEATALYWKFNFNLATNSMGLFTQVGVPGTEREKG